MGIHPEAPALLVGEYAVVGHEYGEGVDYYLTVTDSEGRSTEQTVYWTWAKTAHQVAEEAVAAHLGKQESARPTAPTREMDGRFIVTMS